MATSKAKKLANKLNARRSTGPRTADGKARSRQNSLKHGMSGEGLCIPPEDAKEVEARFDAMAEALMPLDEQERTLTRRACLMAVRVDRAANQEAATLKQRVRDAFEDHDAKVMADLFATIKQLEADPAATVWKLKRTVQGVDWLIEQWQSIHDFLTNRKKLGLIEVNLAELLQGRRLNEVGDSRTHVLAHAICGEYGGLPEGCWNALTREEEVKSESLVELDAILGLKVQRLKEHRATLNTTNAEISRQEAPLRAVVDLSPAGQLLRRYEGAAAREMHKIFAHFDEKKAVEAIENLDATPDPEATSVELGSFGTSTEPESIEPDIEPVATPECRVEEAKPTDSRPIEEAIEAVEGVEAAGRVAPNDLR